MSVPEHLWRFPTAEAISKLASRFNFPTGDHMQDGEWEVADARQIDAFLDAYQSGELNDDERFTLMETIIQSFEDLDHAMTSHPRWADFLLTIETNIDLHIYSVWYWSDVVDELEDEVWYITQFLREILRPHKSRFETAC